MLYKASSSDSIQLLKDTLTGETGHYLVAHYDDFTGFERRNGRFPLYYVCMTQYDATMPNVDVAFKPASLENTFGEYIAKKGLSQLRIAETEKYAHVTFFFNGGVEAPFENEDRALINSPKVATYDLQPEMSAPPRSCRS